MTFDASGQRVVVTGASSGIGAALAEALAAAGATVGICARREDRLLEVLERCQVRSPDSRHWVVDLADPAAVDRLAVDAVAELGGVDMLVNNAGIPLRRHVTRLDNETVESTMALNYLSPIRLTLALLPAMVERGSGKIVNVSSVAATLSSPGEAAYDASKAAITAFGEAMAIDLWDTGVTVLTVYPGLFATELVDAPGNEPIVAAIEPAPVSELVDAVLDALERGTSQVYAPAWFGEVAATKAKDVDAFLAGTAAYLRQQQPPG